MTAHFSGGYALVGMLIIVWNRIEMRRLLAYKRQYNMILYPFTSPCNAAWDYAKGGEIIWWYFPFSVKIQTWLVWLLPSTVHWMSYKIILTIFIFLYNSVRPKNPKLTLNAVGYLWNKMKINSYCCETCAYPSPLGSVCTPNISRSISPQNTII